MKKTILFFSLLIIASLLPSCDVDHEEGDWYYCRERVDLSQKNKFGLSLFLNDWVLTNVYNELYKDGEFIIRDEEGYFPPLELSFTRIGGVYVGDKEYYWEYQYNHICSEAIGSPNQKEVMDLNEDVMILRWEELLSSKKTAFFKDPSGYHSFHIWEFHPKQEESE